MACEFVAAAKRWGLTVSIRKTKGMAVGPGSVGDPVDVGNGNEIAMVREFPYLGSMISASGSVDTEVSRRLAKASQVLGCLQEPVFLCRHASLCCH